MAPAAAPAATPKAKPLPAPEHPIGEWCPTDDLDNVFADSGVLSISLNEDMDPLQGDIEQVVVLFANGQDAAARSLLDVFVRSYRGAESLRFWAMYFDFLQLSGDRANFERLGLLFAESCETSPPAWREKDSVQPALSADVANFDLHGVLTADNAESLLPLAAAVEKKRAVQLVCSRLQGCDDAVAGQLAKTFLRARQLAVPLTLLGGDRLLATLRNRLAAGKREHAATWQLCFETLQRLGDFAEFEEKAIEFAVAFEVSPPSWVEIPVAQRGTALQTKQPEQPRDAYYLSGDICRNKFDELPDVCKKHHHPVLDFSAVRRLDFSSAGQLANRLAALQQVGREIVIRNPNHLVAELLGVVGIDKYARILLPKT